MPIIHAGYVTHYECHRSANKHNKSLLFNGLFITLLFYNRFYKPEFHANALSHVLKKMLTLNQVRIRKTIALKSNAMIIQYQYKQHIMPSSQMWEKISVDGHQ
jgi:hypothetical protein